MKKLLLISLNFCFVFTLSNAQSFVKYWDKTYGGDKLEWSKNILYTGNDELMLSGFSYSDTSGDKTDPLCSVFFGASNIWLLKIDTSLNIIWQNNIGGNVKEVLPDIHFDSPNNNYIFSCQSLSDSGCDKSEDNWGNADYWICCTDTAGNKIWDKRFGSASADYEPKMVCLNTGDYIVSGKAGPSVSGDKTIPGNGGWDFWTIKFDSLGNKIWDKSYGGNGEDQLHSIITLPAGSFIIAGETDSDIGGDISDSSRGVQDMWIIKIDSAGNKLWDKRYGGSGGEHCNYIHTTSDNGFILCGFTFSPQDGDVSDTPRGGTDYWIIKTDSLGNKQWDKRYGGLDEDQAICVKPSLDGGYWVAGYTDSDSSGDVSEPSYGAADYWILKLDSAGNKIWDKRFGGTGADYPTDFVFMPDSSIILFGYADSGTSVIKTDAGKGSSDYWLVRFKYAEGNVGINENTNQNNSISVYPNPTTGIINLKNRNFGNATINVYNLIGENIYSKNIQLAKQKTFDFSFLESGMYFLKVDNDKFSNTVKFIKE